MSPLAERLRRETRPLHEQTETLFYTDALQAGTLSAKQYLHLLHTHLLFHQALETAIDRHPDFFRDYEPHTRRKTPWLLTDLTHLDSIPAHNPPDFFADWTPAQLLGAAYVGEGSMLGGTVIAKLLQQNEAVQPLLDQARFYQGYGPETGRYWKNFGAFLAKQGAHQPDEVVAGASRAFRQYQAAFEMGKNTLNVEPFPT